MKKSRTITVMFSTWMVWATPLLAQIDLGVAEYADSGELLRPENLDQWVMMGASLGSDYNSEPFNPESPGVIGVVQMEPSAYQYFLENNEYADGTMFLLSFYASQAKSQPQLQGFVQGDLRAQEIHVIDTRRFSENRGFFMFPDGATQSAKVPDGSECIECHEAEGQYNATFSQFYPTIRNLIPD